MGCCSSAAKSVAPPRSAPSVPGGATDTPPIFTQYSNADGVKYYVERAEAGGLVTYKYHDINGNPNAKGTSILAAGAESKFPVQYAVSMQKATSVGTMWEQTSGNVLYHLEEKLLPESFPFRMLRIKDAGTDAILYTIRYLLDAGLVEFQCDIYKGDFGETNEARYLRLYKFRVDDTDPTKRALKTAKDGTLAAWSVDPDLPGHHFRILVAPGFETALAAALLSACCFIGGE